MARENFDYPAEGGYWYCGNCNKPWYPMEVDEECPDCLANCRFYKPGQGMSEQLIRDTARRHGLTVEKRVTTGGQKRHFATFEVCGDELEKLSQACKELASAYSPELSRRTVRDFCQLRRSDIDGKSYIEVSSVWCCLRYEDIAQVGDRIRSYDFSSSKDCYIEGKIVVKSVEGGKQGYAHFAVEVEKEVFNGEEVIMRVGETVYVPMEIASADYDGRIERV